MRSLTIGKKMYLAFASLVLLMLVLGGVSIYRLTDLTKTFVMLQEEYSPIADHAMEIQIELLQSRRHEKDFISRKDPKYIERMDRSLKSLEEHSTELTNLAGKLGLTEIEEQSQTIAKDMGAYQASFNIIDLAF